MDTLNRYRHIIQNLLTEYGAIKDPYGNTEGRTMFDVANDRYLLLDMGWEGQRRLHDCVIHIEIIEGQVWIQQNNTDQRIGEQMVLAGIPREQIVIGFQPPELRPYSNFGTGITKPQNA